MCQFFLIFLAVISVKSFVEGQENGLKNDTTLKVKSIEGRIIGGEEAYLGQLPNQVYILIKITGGNYLCGGTIIDLKWILSAAHCVYHEKIQVHPSSMKVVAGTLELQGNSKTRRERTVSSIIVHQKYDNKTRQNDLSLLELKDPFDENDAIQIAKMPMAPMTPGTVCRVAGWGSQKENSSEVSNELMFVDIPLLSQNGCRERLSKIIPAGFLCAGLDEGGKDTCQGDSGSGLICDDFLTGVTTYGKGCAEPRTPGLYGDVYFHKEWINSSILQSHVTNYSNRSHEMPFFVNIFWLVSLSFFTFMRSIY